MVAKAKPKTKRKRQAAVAKKKPQNTKYIAYLITLILIILVIASTIAYSIGIISSTTFEAYSSILLELFFPAIVFSYMFGRGKGLGQIISELGLSKQGATLKAILIGILLFGAILLLSVLISVFSTVTNIPLPTNVQQVLAGTPLYFLLFAALVAPICEEILFRGFLVPRIGIILSAIIFAVLHLSYLSISEFAAALIFGLLAGYVFKRTKSLYPSIIAHILVNLLAVSSLIYLGGMFIHF
jgi:uncharacterized protein